MKLPFWIYPRHWGLQGKDKERALINYNYTGIDADLRIADLTGLTEYERESTKNTIHFEYKIIDEFTYEKTKNDIDLKYKKISKKEHTINLLTISKTLCMLSEEEFDTKMVETIDDEFERSIEALRVNLKYNHITQMEYDKDYHTLHKKPWFNLDMNYEESNNAISVEFDYNEYFIKYLRDLGHPGDSDDEIIDNFIRDRGRIMATDDYDGSENFTTQTSESTSDVEEIPEGFREYK